MKRLVLIAALSLLSITAASSMDNGESDKFNSFDFVVKIKKQVSKTTKKSIINTTKGKYIRTSTRTSFSTCSAVVIDSNIILTAAHCCYDRGGEFVHKSDYGINTGQGAYQSNNLTCTVPVEYSRLYRDNTDFYEKRKKLSLPDAAELSKIPANQVLSIKSVAYDVGVMISKKPISVKHRVRLIFNDPIFSLIVNDREYSNEVKSNSFANRMLIKSVEFFKKYENYKPVLIGMGSHDCKLLPNKMFDKTTCKQSEQRKWKEVKIYTNKDNLGGSLRHLGDDQFIMLLIAYLDDKSIIGAPGDSGGALVLVDPSGVNSPILIGIVSGGTSTTGNFSSLLMNGHLVFDAMKKMGIKELPTPWVQPAVKYRPATSAVPQVAQDQSPFKTLTVPMACTNSNALGVSRVVEIDTTGGPGFGFGDFKQHDFLREGEVVLTFDDGPWLNNTPAVLKALADECVKATFFPVGKHSTYYPDILKQVWEAGHTIGSHTWSHQDLSKKTIEEAKEEIEKGITAVEAALGRPITPFFRFPVVLSHPPEVISYLKKNNIAIFSTDLDAFEKEKRPTELIDSILDKLRKRGKGIVLMHDFNKVTADAMPELLKQLNQNGFKIVHVVARTNPSDAMKAVSK